MSLDLELIFNGPSYTGDTIERDCNLPFDLELIAYPVRRSLHEYISRIILTVITFSYY